MIKELSLVNFQSHKDSCLHFHNNVNVIIGHSDVGKTAIIRALKWLIFNKPSGDSFRSSWGGKTSVEIFTDDAHIVRSKDKDNEYVLGDTHFKAFGTDVPQEIAAAFNINDLNLQQQLDNVFLFSQSPGEVASHFNKVAHLEKIDSSTSNVNSAIRSLEQDIKYKTGEVEKQEEALKAFDHLDKFEAEVEVLEQMENQLRGLKSSLENLQLLYHDYCDYSQRIDEYKSILEDEERVDTILKLWSTKDVQEVLLSKFEQLLQNLFLVQDDIEVAQETVKDEGTVNNLLDLMSKRKTANEALSGLNKLLSQYNSISNALRVDSASIKGLEAKFKKEMGTVCLLCGQKIK